jgi:predicted N-acyltransferase
MAQIDNYRTQIVSDLKLLSGPAWDTLLAGAPLNGAVFMKHAFLKALQDTGCVGGESGWDAHFVCLFDPQGALAAAAPLWIKSHSYGEYVFDWAWAEAYHRHGLAYYPKGLVAVPFTPVPGPRLLARDSDARAALLQALIHESDRLGLSSLHLLFSLDEDARCASDAGLLHRDGVQFHWHNPGWADFDDYLQALAQPKRKKIRAERRRVAEAGITTRALPGEVLTEGDWDVFVRCYRNTYVQHHATPYLSREFFFRLARQMPEHLLMVQAERAGRPIASALLFRDHEALYGRYWGALEAVDCLHFEASYYTPIRWAIEQGLKRFEGGAQGEHKMARGFQPTPTASHHRLAHPAFSDAVSRFLERERGGVDAYLDELRERNPMRSA